MSVGWRNRLLAWSEMGVPFKPHRSDLLDTTRRAMGVLKAGNVLIIAGEGRLSDREGEIVPLYNGAAYFALRAKVPVLPVAVIGTRWLRFGGNSHASRRSKLLPIDGLRADRAGVETLDRARPRSRWRVCLRTFRSEPPPGPVGRWLTDLFADRPWLDDPDLDESRQAAVSLRVSAVSLRASARRPPARAGRGWRLLRYRTGAADRAGRTPPIARLA